MDLFSLPNKIDFSPYEGYIRKGISFKDSTYIYYCKRIRCHAKGAIPFGSNSPSDLVLREEHSPECSGIMEKKREIQAKQLRAEELNSLAQEAIQELYRRLEAIVSTA